MIKGAWNYFESMSVGQYESFLSAFLKNKQSKPNFLENHSNSLFPRADAFTSTLAFASPSDTLSEH